MLYKSALLLAVQDCLSDVGVLYKSAPLSVAGDTRPAVCTLLSCGPGALWDLSSCLLSVTAIVPCVLFTLHSP